MTTSAPKKKNLEVEYLRGVAVSLAILTHLPILLPFLNQALTQFYFTVAMPASGVDLFFCISGFVVSKAFLEFFDQHIARGRFTLAFQVFWLRRAFRLLPTAWLWVLAGLACSVLFNSTGVFATPMQNLRSAAVVVTACGNFANQFGMLLHPNDVYWSLALEEQFYFLFPLFLLVVPALWRWRVLLALVAVQFLVNRNITLATTPAVAMAAGFRLDGIMWGVLIFLFSRTPQYLQLEPTFLRSSRVALAAVNGLLIYLLIALPAQFALLPITMGLVALLAAALVFMASFDRGYATPLPFLNRFFVLVGARSYAVYIIHVFAYRLTFEVWSRYAATRGVPLGVGDTLPMVATAALLLLVLVECNYRFVELPLRDKGMRMAQARMQEFAR